VTYQKRVFNYLVLALVAGVLAYMVARGLLDAGEPVRSTASTEQVQQQT
jgi:hypothetical protein